MSELVVNGLVRKRAELAGEIEHTQAKLRTLMGDAGSLDAAIRVFNPDYKVTGIKAKAFRPAREGQKRGEVSRAVLGIVREASAPLTTREIAERVTPGVDAATMKLTIKRVGLALTRQRERGLFMVWPYAFSVRAGRNSKYWILIHRNRSYVK